MKVRSDCEKDPIAIRNYYYGYICAPLFCTRKTALIHTLAADGSRVNVVSDTIEFLFYHNFFFLGHINNWDVGQAPHAM